MALKHFFYYVIPFSTNFSFYTAYLKLIKNVKLKNKGVLFQYYIFQTIISLNSLRCTALHLAPNLTERQRIIACDLIYFFYNEHFNIVSVIVFGTFTYIVYMLVFKPNTKNCQLLANIVLKNDDSFFIYKKVETVCGQHKISICKKLQNKMLFLYNLTQCFLFSFGKQFKIILKEL